MKNNKGFTLVELMVAMGLFIIILMITGRSFDSVLSQSSKLFRAEESNIEGVVGLEMLRHDLQQAGLGLYTEVPEAISEPEQQKEAASAPASTYNDYPDNHVPRPIVADNNVSTTAVGNMTVASSILAGTDYLVIKATTVARNQTSQKWSYLVNNSGMVAPTVWQSAAENYKDSDHFVVLRKQFATTQRTILEKNMRDNSHEFHLTTPAFDDYTSQASSTFLTYGVDDSSFRFPFNRADYFVARTNNASNMPAICAPTGTGVLYKATINQNNGLTKSMPLVDCVADMQVVLGWDMNLDGVVDNWSNANATAYSQDSNDSFNSSASAIQAALSQASNDINDSATPNIRNSLKVVKVYLVVQDGKKDPTYTSPATIPYGEATGESALIGSGASNPAVFTLTNDMLNYRWKVYRLIVRPKNLLSNQ